VESMSGAQQPSSSRSAMLVLHEHQPLEERSTAAPLKRLGLRWSCLHAAPLYCRHRCMLTAVLCDLPHASSTQRMRRLRPRRPHRTTEERLKSAQKRLAPTSTNQQHTTDTYKM